MEVKCHATGDKAVVQFTPYSKARERYRELNGAVLDNKGEVREEGAGEGRYIRESVFVHA